MGEGIRLDLNEKKTGIFRWLVSMIAYNLLQSHLQIQILWI